jgi:hypothetical protein
MIQPEKLAEIYKYTNGIRNKQKREYANAYVSYLRNGGYGNEPERGGLSCMGAQAVRIQLNSMHPWG